MATASLLGRHTSTTTTLNFKSGKLATLLSAAGGTYPFNAVISFSGQGYEIVTITSGASDIATATRGVYYTAPLDFPDNADVNVHDTPLIKTGQQILTSLIQPQASGRVTSTVNTTSQSLGNITGLSFAVGANESWIFRFKIFTGSTTAAGIRIGFTFPNGATIVAGTIFGATTALNAFNSEAIPASGVPSTNAYNTVNSQIGWINVEGGIINSSTPGTFQVQGLKVTSGMGSVLVNSHFTAQKIN